MNNTWYDSPHGLWNKSNYSTVEDYSLFVMEAMKNSTFREVVGTCEMKISVQNINGQ